MRVVKSDHNTTCSKDLLDCFLRLPSSFIFRRFAIILGTPMRNEGNKCSIERVFLTIISKWSIFLARSCNIFSHVSGGTSSGCGGDGLQIFAFLEVLKYFGNIHKTVYCGV